MLSTSTLTSIRPVPCRLQRIQRPTHRIGAVRVNSTLSQQTPSSSNDNTAAKSESTQKGTLFGAVALITGSSVGAGMLALPAVTSSAGLGPSCIALCATWGVLTLEALLMAEVNLAVRNPEIDSPDTIITLRQMAERTLGPGGKAITLIYLLLSYSLLVAYLTKASEVLDFFAGHALPPSVAALILTGGMASLLLGGGPEAADKVNQGLTSVLLVAFLGILAAGSVQADVGAALLHGPDNFSALSGATPILFLSLVYHDLVPFIVQYMDGNRTKIRQALVLGSLVPLAMFLTWESVALGLLPNELSTPQTALQITLPLLQDSVSSGSGSSLLAAIPAVVNGGDYQSIDGGGLITTAVSAEATVTVDAVKQLAVDPLEVFVRRSGPVVGTAVQSFSFLAVVTSFIGTVLGLSETLRSEIPPLVEETARKLDVALCALSNTLKKEEEQLQRQRSLSASIDSSGSESDVEDILTTTSSGSIPLTQLPPARRQSVMSFLNRAILTKVASSLDIPLSSHDEDTNNNNSIDTLDTPIDTMGDSCPPSVLFNASDIITDANSDNGRALALMLCLLPPLGFAAYNPGSFLAVLSVAGGYGMTLLYGLLPPMMAWKLRAATTTTTKDTNGIDSSKNVVAQQQQRYNVVKPFVPGGKPVLISLFSVAAAVEISRVVSDVGVGIEERGGMDGIGRAAEHAMVQVVETVGTAAVSWLPILSY